MIHLKNKKIAVFGLGMSGVSAIRLLSSFGADIIAINAGKVDSWAKSPGVLDYVDIDHCFTEDDEQLKQKLKEIELVILSPGIPREHPLLATNLSTNIPIWGELECAYRVLEEAKKLSPIIGITGTNGKTTTTTFLGEMLAIDGRSVFVGGNIGVPFCDYAHDLLIAKTSTKVDFILLELSSFQLESIDHFHVDIALILNLYQNHGERYESIEDYGIAKFHITNRFTENDILIYPEDNLFIKKWAEVQKGKKKTVDTERPVSRFDLTHFKLPGIHNRVNLNFILEVAEALQLSDVNIQKSIDSFRGVHHRIEFVEGIKDLPYFKAYNDAKSTNWEATMTAVRAMEEIPGKLYLILGGQKRGGGDSILPYIDFLKSKVHFFYLIGEMGSEIENELSGHFDSTQYKRTETLDLTVEHLRKNSSANIYMPGILLLSPAFPSLDQFKNYAYRGEHFMNLLGRKDS